MSSSNTAVLTGRMAGIGRIPLLGSLIRTSRDPAAAVARIALGLMIVPHGMQKVFGAFSRDQLVRVLSRRRK